jgi:hypothetical protein
MADFQHPPKCQYVSRCGELADLHIDGHRRCEFFWAREGARNRGYGLGLPVHRDRYVIWTDDGQIGRIEAFPAGAGQVDLRPSVRGGTSGFRGRAVHIAADESRGDAQPPTAFEEERCEIAARALAESQGFRRVQHALLLAYLIAEALVDSAIHAVQDTEGLGPLLRHAIRIEPMCDSLVVRIGRL